MSKNIRLSITSSLLKILISLKLCQGGKTGDRGATLEEITMNLVKTYGIDGDIKSQVLASLKYAVRLNLIEKRKDRFFLVLPGAGIQLAPCKCKYEEAQRLACIYPPVWETSCNTGSCDVKMTCCGVRKRKAEDFCSSPRDIGCRPRHGNESCGCKVQLPKKPERRCEECAASGGGVDCFQCAVKRKRTQQQEPPVCPECPECPSQRRSESPKEEEESSQDEQSTCGSCYEG